MKKKLNRSHVNSMKHDDKVEDDDHEGEMRST
jgi:hypothetical protein